MHVLVRCRIFGARPKRHLASIFPIEGIAFNTGRCLIGAHILLTGFFMKLGKAFMPTILTPQSWSVDAFSPKRSLTHSERIVAHYDV